MGWLRVRKVFAGVDAGQSKILMIRSFTESNIALTGLLARLVPVPGICQGLLQVERVLVGLFENLAASFGSVGRGSLFDG